MPPAKKRAPTKPSPPRIRLERQPSDDGDGEWHAVVPLYRYRFMFANGDVEWVVTDADDSTLRSVLLETRNTPDDRIVGVSDGSHVGECLL